MFIGHYGVSFAAKPLATGVPLWVWFIAVQWMDVVWSVLVLVGIEKRRIFESSPAHQEHGPRPDGDPTSVRSLPILLVRRACL